MSVRLYATGMLVKEDNGRSVRRIYSTSTIGWQNSTLDRRKFYDIKSKLQCGRYNFQFRKANRFVLI